MSDLNEKTELFCREYLIDYNGTKAATRAGYSEKTASAQASRLLRNVKVLSRVRELQAEKTKRLVITQDWVVQGLVDMVEKCMKPVEVMEWDHDKRELKKAGVFSFDSKGAAKGLELLGKHLGMYVEKTEIKQTVEVTSKLASILEELRDVPDHNEGG